MEEELLGQIFQQINHATGVYAKCRDVISGFNFQVGFATKLSSAVRNAQKGLEIEFENSDGKLFNQVAQLKTSIEQWQSSLKELAKKHGIENVDSLSDEELQNSLRKVILN
jgi:cupin superfamily acireductone dioxygenase involved in methionine salvage